MSRKITIYIAVLLLFLALLSITLFAYEKSTNGRIHMSEDRKKVLSEKLLSNYPDLNQALISGYFDIAERGTSSIVQCLDRSDEDKCISAVSFIKGTGAECRYLHGATDDSHSEIDHEEEDANEFACIDAVTRSSADKEVDACADLKGDALYNCGKMIFPAYANGEDCLNLQDANARNFCREIFYLDDIYARYERADCEKLNTVNLKKYCLDIITTIDNRELKK